MTGDVYVQSVIDHVPIGLPLRDQMAMELRSHIAERVQAGQPLDEVLRQLGDPLTLAESYLAEVPMQSAALPARFAAKVIDVIAVVGFVLAVAAVLFAVLPREAAVFLPVLCLLSAIFGLIDWRSKRRGRGPDRRSRLAPGDTPSVRSTRWRRLPTTGESWPRISLRVCR